MIARVLLSLIVILCQVIGLIALQELDYDVVCWEGDLYGTFDHLKSFSVDVLANDAKKLHALSALYLILYSDIVEAVKLHEKAKSLSPSTVPPLAALYLEGKACGGLGDLFYVTAVIIKRMSQSEIDHQQWRESLKQLITLTSDSGLTQAAERHITTAIELDPNDTSLRFRAALLTPGVLSSFDQLTATRARLVERVSHLQQNRDSLTLSKLDEFSLSPTFYYVYQGYEDKSLLQSLHVSYSVAHPALMTASSLPPLSPSAAVTSRGAESKVRIGFVSSFFRRHSICKLFCGLIIGLDPDSFEVVIFSTVPKQKEDSMTASLQSKRHVSFIRVNHLLLSNRQIAIDQHLDILVYLDVGMEPSTVAWAAGRLAPCQLALWGHPSTTGLSSIDYYISSTGYHQHTPVLPLPGMTAMTANGDSKSRDHEWPQSSFSEQLVQLDGLNFAFSLPTMANIASTSISISSSDIDILQHQPYDSLRELIIQSNDKGNSQGKETKEDQLLHLLSLRQAGRKIILVTQTLPKLHPSFDSILLPLLLSEHRPMIVLLSDPAKKGQWQRTVVARWRQTLSSFMQAAVNHCSIDTNSVDDIISNGILWIEGPLSPQRYLILQLLGDLAIDPFPFGGGVTTLESLAVCTPVLTLPSLQTVPQLADGMLTAINEQESLVASSVDDMLDKAKLILGGEEESGSAMRKRLCDKRALLFFDSAAHRQEDEDHRVAGLAEWNQFLLRLVK